MIQKNEIGAKLLKNYVKDQTQVLKLFQKAIEGMRCEVIGMR